MMSEKAITDAGVQRVTMDGQRFVLLPVGEYRRLKRAAESREPDLPPPDAQGNYPAVATLRAMLARDIVRQRRALGLSQAELARRAGIRVETLNRLEQGKHSPSVPTVEKIDGALKDEAARKTAAAKPPGARPPGRRKYRPARRTIRKRR